MRLETLCYAVITYALKSISRPGETKTGMHGRNRSHGSSPPRTPSRLSMLSLPKSMLSGRRAPMDAPSAFSSKMGLNGRGHRSLANSRYFEPLSLLIIHFGRVRPRAQIVKTHAVIPALTDHN